MKITKLGHCCLLIETKGKKILTDPGAYSTKQSEVKDIDIILITHEHVDHLHVDSLKAVLKNNPKAKIYTNSGVAKILDTEKIAYTLLEHGQEMSIENIDIAGYGEEHAFIYETVPAVKNTGYFIDNKLFYPGDAFYNPNKPIEVLALPVAGPWMKISEALDYAKKLKPKVCFPVHDGMLQPDKMGPVHRAPVAALAAAGIEFVVMTEGDTREF